MKKSVLLALLACCLAVDIFGLTLDQCPSGYRCRKRVTNGLSRLVVPQTQEEMDIEICEAGTYSPGGADECTPCEKGTYAAKPGAPACYACPKGHMCSRTNEVPEQCPVGTFNDLTRQTCCRVCQSGKFTWLKGMSECDDCPSGYKCRPREKLSCELEATTTSTTVALTTITYSENFTYDVKPISQCINWSTFIANLPVKTYTLLKIQGTYDTVGLTVNDPTVINNITQALRTSGSYGPVISNGAAWTVGTCGSGTELSANSTICECSTSGYSVRPCTGNQNYGGIGTTNCKGPNQIMTVTFQY